METDRISLAGMEADWCSSVGIEEDWSKSAGVEAGWDNGRIVWVGKNFSFFFFGLATEVL